MRPTLTAILAVALVSGGCSITNGAHAPDDSALTIRVTALIRGGQKTIALRTLRCDPPSGTTPHPAAACAALRDYRTHFRPTNASCGCGAEMYGERSAVVSGRLDGRPFQAELQGCMCGYSELEARDLRIATGLRQLIPPFGTIAGRVLAVGGPGGPLPGAGRRMSHAVVIVSGHDADGIRIGSRTQSGSSGIFQISLPAGTYTVRTRGAGRYHKARVHISPHGVVRVRLVEDIR